MTSSLESEYRPRSVSPPGSTVADILEERSMSQADLATRLGSTPKFVNELVKGKASISRKTALQLERTLGVAADFWLAREARYQEWLARKEDAHELRASVGWLKELPLSDMVRFGWIRRASSRQDQVAECLNFFATATVDVWRKKWLRPLAAFRASSKARHKDGAVAAWLRQGEREAERVKCRPFDRDAYHASLLGLRAMTREPDPDIFVPETVRRCAASGVAVVFVPTPSGCPASGATRWLAANRALLQLSLRYRTNDHLWFSFFHEAAHILKHGKRMLFLESMGGLNAEHEAEADRFARDLLIPPTDARRLPMLGRSKAAVMRFADDIGVAPGIVVGRMQKEDLLPWSHLNGLKVSYTWAED